MISPTDLQHRFGFTRNEVTLILFLSVSLMAGAAIRWIRSDNQGGMDIPQGSLYAASDSEFTARSAAADADTVPPGPVAPSPPLPPHPPPPPRASTSTGLHSQSSCAFPGSGMHMRAA